MIKLRFSRYVPYCSMLQATAYEVTYKSCRKKGPLTTHVPGPLPPDTHDTHSIYRPKHMR